MNQLKVISIDGRLVTESRDVAEMVGQQHKELLRTIRGYIAVLTGADMRSSDFFVPHTYLDAKKEVRPCFLLTRKGCDMVANKMTGEKGVLFTAEYVNKFEEMEHTIKSNVVPLNEKQSLVALMKLSAITAEETEELKQVTSEHSNKLQLLEHKLENEITLDHGEQRRLQKAVAMKAYELCDDTKKRPRYFREIYREIKDRFGVASYKDVKRHELQSAIRYVENWIPRKVS